MPTPFDLPSSQGPQPQAGPQMPPGQGMPQQAAPQAPDSLAHVETSYNKLKEAQGLLTKVKGGLDHLVTLGDTVTTDDIVQTAGKLIGGGITAEGMASLLAQMPDSNPEQLMMWIAERDKDVTQRIAQTDQMAQQFRHEMGTLAVKKIMGNGQAEQAMPAQDESAPAGPNDMTPASTGAGNSMGL